MEKNLSLEDLFTSDVKNAFHYDIVLANNNNESGLKPIFEKLKGIFIQGLVIISDGSILNENKEQIIDIEKMTEDDFKKIKDRMLSIGVEAKYRIFDTKDKDYYLRGMMYKLEKIKGIKMTVTSDWHSQLISKVDFHLNNKEILPKLMSTLEHCPEANYFLNMTNPKILKDYCIKNNKKDDPEKLHVINFDAAKITDYQYQHRFCDQFTKHIK